MFVIFGQLLFSNILKIWRRSNDVAPEPGEEGNLPGSDLEKDKQGDCQRAKQVPLNPGTGTWEMARLAYSSPYWAKVDRKATEMYAPD